MSNFDPGPLAHVEGHPADGGWTVVFVREFRHSPQTVWSALTDPAQLRQWAPYTADRSLDRGGPMTLRMIDGAHEQDLPGTVLSVEPPRLLEYSWGPDDVLRWELEASELGTRLTLRHSVSGREWMPKVAAGWHLCLRVAEELLAGTPIPPIRGEEALEYGWNELADAYAVALNVPSPMA